MFGKHRQLKVTGKILIARGMRNGHIIAKMWRDEYAVVSYTGNRHEVDNWIFTNN